MKKIFLTFVFGLLAMSAVQAQGNIVSFTYSMGFGTGDLSDFISQPSFRGANFDFRKMVQPNIGKFL